MANGNRMKTPSPLQSLREQLKTQAVDLNEQQLSPEALSQQLSDKTFLITGGASGFGQAIANEIGNASRTARIIVADLNASNGEAVASDLRSKGNPAQYLDVDVASWESQAAMFANALRWLRDSGYEEVIDHVICSAGTGSETFDLDPVSPEGLLKGEVPQAPLTRCVRVNLEGSVYTTHLAIKYAMGLDKSSSSRHDKSITLIGSLSGYNSMPRKADYSSSKWGIRGFFKSLVDESDGTIPPSAASKVRINLLAPFFVRTNIISEERFQQLLDVGVRLADIDDITKAVMCFTSDPTLHGRSIGVSANGLFDWKDDIAHGFGAESLAQEVETGALRIPRDISHSLTKPQAKI